MTDIEVGKYIQEELLKRNNHDQIIYLENMFDALLSANDMTWDWQLHSVLSDVIHRMELD